MVIIPMSLLGQIYLLQKNKREGKERRKGVVKEVGHGHYPSSSSGPCQ